MLTNTNHKEEIHTYTYRQPCEAAEMWQAWLAGPVQCGVYFYVKKKQREISQDKGVKKQQTSVV
jgi:uncharacterized phage-associated protein